MFVVYGLHSILYLGGVCVAHAYDKWIYNCKLVRVLCGRGTTRARSPCVDLSLLARARRDTPRDFRPILDARSTGLGHFCAAHGELLKSAACAA